MVVWQESAIVQGMNPWECHRWAVDEVKGRPYCWQHARRQRNHEAFADALESDEGVQAAAVDQAEPYVPAPRMDLPRRFTLYRAEPPEGHTLGGYANAPDTPQLEGVVFTDGTVCVRWLTDLRSHSLWPDFETFDRVHGHPEYKSALVWHDA
jgi:hypothetical protein